MYNIIRFWAAAQLNISHLALLIGGLLLTLVLVFMFIYVFANSPGGFKAMDNARDVGVAKYHQQR